jgi:hypothetical protein
MKIGTIHLIGTVSDPKVFAHRKARSRNAEDSAQQSRDLPAQRDREQIGFVLYAGETSQIRHCGVITALR